MSNVVPFPRDWIGPTEDLIPVGPSAEGTPDEGLATLDEDEELGRALGADAFWGERSASLHEAIEAPMPAERAPAEQLPEDESGRAGSPGQPATVDRRSGTRPVLSARGGTVRSGARYGRRGMVAAVSGLALASALAAGVAVAVGTQARPRSSAGRHVLAQAPAVRARGSESQAMARLVVAGAMRETVEGRGKSLQRTARHRAGHARPKAHGAATRTSTVLNVSYTGSEPTGPSAASSPASGGGSGETSSVTASPTDGSSASGGSSSSGTTGGSGPVGAGAPFGPGQMGSTKG